MKKTKYCLRIIFLLVTVALIISVNRKPNDGADSIAEIKIKMIQKMRNDSLNTKHKFDILVQETTKFFDGSNSMRNKLDYLMGLIGLWAVFEFAFLVIRDRNYGRQEIK